MIQVQPLARAAGHSVCLPNPRGPVSRAVINALQGGGDLPLSMPPPAGLDLDDEDLQLALWLLNLSQVFDFTDACLGSSSAPGLAALHRQLEDAFEACLRSLPIDSPGDLDLAATLEHIRTRPSSATAPVSPAAADPARVLKIFQNKAPYLAWEADPHTLALAGIEQELKRDFADIQSGEYGVGYELTHAQIYRRCLRVLQLGLRETLQEAPAVSFAFANSAWLFGRRRQLRGAALGQLCLLEIDSVEPCAAQIAAWDAAGLPAAGRQWYDVHVLADAEHEIVVRERLLPTLQRQTPWLLSDAIFGAEVTRQLQDQMAAASCDADHACT